MKGYEKGFREPDKTLVTETIQNVGDVVSAAKDRAYISAIIAHALYTKNVSLSAIPRQAVDLADKILAELKR